MASVRYLQDLMTFLQRPDTSPGSPLSSLYCSAAVVCSGTLLHTVNPIGYLIWIFQDIKVGYHDANGDVAWIQNEDANGYFRVTGRDNTKDI